MYLHFHSSQEFLICGFFGQSVLILFRCEYQKIVFSKCCVIFYFVQILQLVEHCQLKPNALGLSWAYFHSVEKKILHLRVVWYEKAKLDRISVYGKCIQKQEKNTQPDEKYTWIALGSKS